MLTVGTWNVENLFRPGPGSGRPPDQAIYDAKLDALAATINRFAPDVLAVQEVGEPEALADLVKLLDGDWATHVSIHPDGRGIRVGVIARLPVEETEDVVESHSSLVRCRPAMTGGSLCGWAAGHSALGLTPR